MDTEPVPSAFSRIMAVAEGGSGLPALAGFALRFGTARARLRLVDLVANPAALFPALKLCLPDWADTHEALVYGAQCTLRAAAARLPVASPAIEVELLDLAALHAGASEALATAARAWHADLVAVAAHPRGHRWACRLDPAEIALALECPVLYVPTLQLALTSPPLERALIAIDGSANSIAALRLALAALPAATCLRVVYGVDRCVGGPWLARLFASHGVNALATAEPLLAARGGRAAVSMISTRDEQDDVAAALLREAGEWRADLVVMGLRGHRAHPRGLPGSVASRVLRDAACAVLVVPAVATAPPDPRASGLPPAEGADEAAQGFFCG